MNEGDYGERRKCGRLEGVRGDGGLTEGSLPWPQAEDGLAQPALRVGGLEWLWAVLEVSAGRESQWLLLSPRLQASLVGIGLRLSGNGWPLHWLGRILSFLFPVSAQLNSGSIDLI